ncbi:MAG TPA: carboxypeptidase regulatory-like domain-containing protein, partial [Gemmatimonadales bacterium]|nr:carboxypeptidase regulatory-like domain-containing protein [Gemmatimonadales bacterium]
MGGTWTGRGSRWAFAPGRGAWRAAVIAPLLLLLATCQVDKLTNNPPPIARLMLAPGQVRDSAPVGSMAAAPESLAVANGGPGTLSWVAHLQLGQSWLAFVGPNSGTAPAVLRIAFNPAGLPMGVYRDTVIVDAENAANSPGRVPVEFSVQPCQPAPLVVNAPPLTDSLTTSDCAAPHRATSFARLYTFTAAAGDSISIAMASTALDAYLMLDSSTSDAVPPLATNDSCTGGTDACLRYQRLPAAGTYRIEATSAGPAQTGVFTLSVTRPRPPAGVQSLAQLRSDSITAIALGDTTGERTVVLRGILADPDAGDSLRLQVELQPVGTAFTGTPTATGSRVANGQTAFVAATGLANNAAYHWQARGLDQTGRAGPWTSFGGNAESTSDFSTSIPVPPNAPTAMGQFQGDGNTAIAVGGTATGRSVIFKATVTDSNPGDQLRLDVEAEPVGTAFKNSPSGSGAPIANGAIATATLAGLTDNTAYHWQARIVDQTGRAGPWASFGNNAETATDFRVAVAVTQLVFTVQPTGAVAGIAMVPAVQVNAQDALGNTVASFTGNVTVSIANNAGGGTLSGTVTVTAVNGVASFSTLSIDKVGSGYTLTASATGLTTTSGTFAITPAAAKQLAFTVQPTTTPAGVTISPAVQVTARDSFGNAATSFTGGVTLALGANPGSGTLSGTLTRNAGAGVATFADLTIDKAGTGYTLTAAAPAAGLTAGTSAPFTVSAATAGKLALLTPPSAAAQSGVPLAQQPVLQIEDANGNPVSQAGVVVTATPSAGSLVSPTTTSDANGRATFAGLAISGAMGSYTLSFGAAGLVPVTSGTITLSPGPPSTLAIVTQPSTSVQSGAAFPVQPVVQLQDAAGNAVSQSGASVTATIATGSAALSGTNPVATTANGRATFTNLAITGVVGARTLTFSATGLTSVTSGSVNVTAGAAAQMAVNAGDNQTATAGTAVPIAPSVIVKDASGNPVPGTAVTFAVASGGGAITGATQTTSANGIATVGSWTLGTSAGANTLTATSGTLSGSPVTFTATGTAGNAGSVAVNAGNNQTATVGTAVSTAPSVIVRDPLNNPVQG